MTIQPQAWWWVWYWSHKDYEVNHYPRGASVRWACNERTRAGDFALMYVKTTTSAIVGVLQATSDATRDTTVLKHTTHPWSCDAKVLRLFKQPVTLEHLRSDRWLKKHWRLVDADFQPPRGKSPQVTAEVLNRLAKHIPELADYVPPGRPIQKRKPLR